MGLSAFTADARKTVRDQARAKISTAEFAEDAENFCCFCNFLIDGIRRDGHDEETHSFATCANEWGTRLSRAPGKLAI